MVKNNVRILIAEDDENFARQFTGLLESEGYEVAWAREGREAIHLIEARNVSLGFIDLAMPGVDGMQILQEAIRLAPELPLIMLTGHGSIERAVQATKLGAFEFLEKPVSMERILVTIDRALEYHALAQKNRWMAADIMSRYRMVGASAVMQQLYDRIDRVASTDATVLISGETGTGKELVARALHLRSKRNAGPLGKVNCAAIPEQLIESQLFGHKKGAFTGAVEDYSGRFVQADGGTLLLDEIGDLSLSAQAKLLRVLQSHEVEPVGGTRSILVDVRIIAATNKDLQARIKAGLFRDDLFYRIAIVDIEVPPLREHKEDIASLANHFLSLFCEENNRYIEEFSPACQQVLLHYDWPGNVRQLRAVVEKLGVLAQGSRITPRDILEVLNLKNDYSALSSKLSVARKMFERDFIHQALVAHNWNVAATAAALDVDRTNLHRKMQHYGLKR